MSHIHAACIPRTRINKSPTSLKQVKTIMNLLKSANPAPSFVVVRHCYRCALYIYSRSSNVYVLSVQFTFFCRFKSSCSLLFSCLRSFRPFLCAMFSQVLFLLSSSRKSHRSPCCYSLRTRQTQVIEYLDHYRCILMRRYNENICL